MVGFLRESVVVAGGAAGWRLVIRSRGRFLLKLMVGFPGLAQESIEALVAARPEAQGRGAGQLPDGLRP